MIKALKKNKLFKNIRMFLMIFTMLFYSTSAFAFFSGIADWFGDTYTLYNAESVYTEFEFWNNIEDSDGYKSLVTQCAKSGGELKIGRNASGLEYAACMAPFDCGYPRDVSSFMKNIKSYCWYCIPFTKIILVSQELAKMTYQGVEAGMLLLMSACFGIWLVVKIITYIAISYSKSPGEFYTEIGTMCFRLLLGALALQMGDNIWNYTVGPIASGVFDYGTQAMRIIPATDVSTDPLNAIGTKIVGDGAAAGGIISAINEKLMDLIGIGWIMVTGSMRLNPACLPVGQFPLFFAGLIFLVFAVIFLIRIPLMCADILFRFALFLILLPMFIFAWVFPLTRSFADLGINMLVNVMVNLLIFALMIALCSNLIQAALNLPNISSMNEIGTVVAALQSEYVMSIGSFLRVIVYLTFCVLVLEQTADISTQISGFVSDTTTFEKHGSSVARGGAKLGLKGGYYGTKATLWQAPRAINRMILGKK